jgi:hypothetical protein
MRNTIGSFLLLVLLRIPRAFGIQTDEQHTLSFRLMEIELNTRQAPINIAFPRRSAPSLYRRVSFAAE